MGGGWNLGHGLSNDGLPSLIGWLRGVSPLTSAFGALILGPQPLSIFLPCFRNILRPLVHFNHHVIEPPRSYHPGRTLFLPGPGRDPLTSR